jgi:uncharacterized linocin/CFP29 family protein
MTQPNKDRDYYRMLSTSELEQLTHYGKDVDWRELAIALAERLADIRDEVSAEVTERD